MQILLFILKVIGIILLILLGLIVIVLSTILFVPVRYEISGEIEDEHKIEAGGVIRYLFSILKVVIAYRSGGLETDIYLFGFRKKKKVLDESETDYLDEIVEDTEAKEAMKSEECAESVEKVKEPEREKKSKTKSVTKTKKSENKFPFELIKRELTDEHNHNVLKKVFRELKYLLSHFGFRKIKTDLIFGAADPALTGQILGILAMFPILYRYEFGIIPDFDTDKTYIKGTFAVAGRIRLIHVFITACRLIFDKEVRMVITKFMDMRKQ